ncbi:WAT1-related protein [Dioscorea alata]|uniref:WAT1-related protein n=1 Tax=Dioscorea alata TaxID=55571 RepID=A0ACB7VDL8_DIOAL|nr:WAT1-related protein [Dioscorea alata]
MDICNQCTLSQVCLNTRHESYGLYCLQASYGHFSLNTYCSPQKKEALGVQGFIVVFIAALIGSTLNQFTYYQGLKLASSTLASAVCNLAPVITFVMAVSMGLEKVEIRSIRSMAKIFGTITCVGGAVSMAVFKGPKILNFELHSKWEDLMKGFLFLIASNCCWSIWLILQGLICKSYLDPLSLATWTCFLSTILSTILTIFVEPSLSIWKINTRFQWFCCLYTGVMGSALTVSVQAWCISKRGPLFSAMFSPLCTVIITILASVLLREELYTGSLAGIAAVITGLYMVLWGKAKDINEEGELNLKDDSPRTTVAVVKHWQDCEGNLEEPLLDGRTNHESQMKEEETK